VRFSRSWQWLGAVVAGVLVVGGAGTVPAQAATPSAWAQDGYGPGNTGYNPHESAIGSGTVGKLKQRWSVSPQAGDPGCNPPLVAPLVVDGRVFLLEGGGVAAYDAKNGKRLWLNTDFSVITARLVVADDVVIVNDTNCYSNSSYDGTVTALDVASGKERWATSQNWRIDTVVADAGRVVVSGVCHTCDGFSNGVVGIRTSNGKKVWSHENTVLAGPVSAGGHVLLTRVGRDDSYAVSVKTGDSVWGSGSEWRASAASPSGKRFYVWNASGLAAVDAASGEQAWWVKNESHALATDDKRVYVASAGRVNAYDAKTGKNVWTRVLAAPHRPIVAGGLVYVVTGNGSLAILRATDGKTVTSGAPFGTQSDHVVVAGGRLFTTNGTKIRTYAP
jgi:outer membrane protein assembly factor BamB